MSVVGLCATSPQETSRTATRDVLANFIDSNFDSNFDSILDANFNANLDANFNANLDANLINNWGSVQVSLQQPAVRVGRFHRRIHSNPALAGIQQPKA